MNYTNNEIEAIKAGAKEYTEWVGDLDGMIRVLSEFKKMNLNYYYDFNGKKCYSLLDDADSCYVKVTGKTREEYAEAQKKWHEEYERREAEEKQKAESSIPGWIEEGKKYIYPQRYDSWTSCVNARANDLYHGLDLVNALDVIKLLENGGSFAEAKKLIDDQNHSGASYGMVMSMLVSFSKQGPAFYRYMEKNISKENEEYLKKVETENEGFAKAAGASQPGEN